LKSVGPQADAPEQIQASTPKALTHSGQRLYYFAPSQKPTAGPMPKITFISPDGTRTDVDVENGYSVMEGAINNNIEGIVAECGGACACATCHSYIDEAWLDKLPAMDDMEDSMLDAAMERKENSRLTCQIEISDDLDGLVVQVAENDY
jgi:2Fe-2S ferredoxin